MNRFSAFGIHLGISFIIFLVLAYLVVFEWYPGMFFDTDGGWRGMRIIIAVDLVLGPTLTLVVYKTGKPGLRTDLAMIGIFQFACLCAGTWIVYEERPIAVVYNDGRFTVMTKDDYTKEASVEVPDLTDFPGDNPKWVMVDIPQDETEQHKVRSSAFKSGRSISTLSELYAPFSPTSPLVVDQGIDPARIEAAPKGREALHNWLDKHGGSVEDYAFYTFSTRYVFGYLIYDKETREQVGLLTRDAASTG